jgi:hypothetical protein
MPGTTAFLPDSEAEGGMCPTKSAMEKTDGEIILHMFDVSERLSTTRRDSAIRVTLPTKALQLTVKIADEPKYV